MAATAPKRKFDAVAGYNCAPVSTISKPEAGVFRSGDIRAASGSTLRQLDDVNLLIATLDLALSGDFFPDAVCSELYRHDKLIGGPVLDHAEQVTSVRSHIEMVLLSHAGNKVIRRTKNQLI